MSGRGSPGRRTPQAPRAPRAARHTTLVAAAGVAAAVFAAALAPPAHATAQSTARIAECRVVLVDELGRDAMTVERLARPCSVLATDLVNELEPSLFDDGPEIAPRDLQPAIEGSADAAGSPAQSDPVASTRPMALGGGTLAAVGSDAGSDAITAMTFNPSVFFGTSEPSAALARNSRLSDVTVYFPVDELDRDEDGDIDYFGLRFRLNASGLSAGREIWDVADSLQSMVRASNAVAATLAEGLAAAPADRLRACVRVLRDAAATGVDVARACGGDIRPVFRLDYDAFRAELGRVRRRADARFWGLDVRMDFGDPTLGAVPDAEATRIGFAFAAGRELVGGADDPLAPSLSLRARAGVHHTALRDIDHAETGFDGGLAVAARRPVGADQAITLTGGFEFRASDVVEALEAAVQSDFLLFRAAMSVPLTDRMALTVALAQPLLGRDHISQQLSVSGNWRLLLPDLGTLGGS